MRRLTKTIILATVLLLSGTVVASAALNYQGRLDAGGQAFDGSVDMIFALFDAESGGNAVGSPITINGVTVQQGLFQVELDFGAQPYAAGLWLQVSVAGQALSPRHRIGAAPLAVQALNDATTAGTGLVLSGSELSIDTAFRLPQACGEGEIAKRAGNGEWVCGAFEATVYTGVPPVDVTAGVISLMSRGVDESFIARGAIHDYEVADGAQISPAKIAGTAATLSGDQVFDGGTLAVDAANDRVGVGTTLPRAALDVRGDIRLDGELLFRSPRTHTLNVAGSAYFQTDPVSDDDHLGTSESGGYLYMGGNLSNPGDTAFGADAIAPISIPAGATVTQMSCDFYDNTTVEDLSGTAYLTRRAAQATSAQTLASMSLSTSGLSGGMYSNFDDTISSPAAIEPSDYLWLRVRIDTGAYSGTLLRFYGCSVEYTVDRLP